MEIEAIKTIQTIRILKLNIYEFKLELQKQAELTPYKIWKKEFLALKI